MIKLATQDKPFFSDIIKEKLIQIRNIGFDGVEIDGDILLTRFEELKRAVNETGVPVTSVCGGYRGWIGDFEKEQRESAIEDITLILKRAGELGALGIVVPAAWGMFSLRLPPMTPPRDSEEDRKVLMDSLDRLECVCRHTGTQILLEPLNRYEDHMLNTLDSAGNLITEGGFDKVKITADFFHMNIEEQDIKSSIIKWGDLIGHVHIADSHRYQPGDGHTDFVHGFEGLRDIGFDKTMAFECRVQGANQEECYRDSVDYIKECIKRAAPNIEG